jgi:hypothetical protein
MANLMNHYSDNRIEVFRQTVERLGMLTGQLQTLEVTLARAKELPDLIARTSHPIQREFLKEEQAIIGHPAGLLIRCLQLDRELRQGFSTIADLMNAALDAAVCYISQVADGTGVCRSDSLVRRHLGELARVRNPLSATFKIASGWQALQAIDSAIASIDEMHDVGRPDFAVSQSMTPPTAPVLSG